jgi:hypothetical protein
MEYTRDSGVQWHAFHMHLPLVCIRKHVRVAFVPKLDMGDAKIVQYLLNAGCVASGRRR